MKRKCLSGSQKRKKKYDIIKNDYTTENKVSTSNNKVEQSSAQVTELSNDKPSGSNNNYDEARRTTTRRKCDSNIERTYYC